MFLSNDIASCRDILEINSIFVCSLTHEHFGFLAKTLQDHDSMSRPKLNLLLIFTYNINSPVIFNFHITWLVFRIF